MCRSAISAVITAVLAVGCVQLPVGGPTGGRAKPRIDNDSNPLVEIKTNKGSMTAELYEGAAKNAVCYFIYLIERMKGVYDNVPVYTATEDRIEAGRRLANAGFRVKMERGTRGHKARALAIKGIAGEWLSLDIVITRRDAFELDGKNTVIGRVIRGGSVVDKLVVGDRIEGIYLLRKRAHDYVPIVYGAPPRRTRRPPPAKRKSHVP